MLVLIAQQHNAWCQLCDGSTLGLGCAMLCLKVNSINAGSMLNEVPDGMRSLIKVPDCAQR
jgi:hypothetical protein